MSAWHQAHDAYVTEHGDDARPEAVRHADAIAPDFNSFSYAPGAVWAVDAPVNYVQIVRPPWARERAA